jgi:hypothetical protein
MTISVTELMLKSLAPENSTVPYDDDPLVTVIDVFAVKVVVRKDADREAFVQFIRERAVAGAGIFCDIDVHRLAEGPSYLELGAWLGDQKIALTVMALGVHHKAWQVITPTSLGFTGKEATEMAGLGLLLIDGLSPEFRAELCATPTPTET